MADARLGLGPLPPAPNDYDRVNEQAFRQQMDSLRRSVEQYVASSRNALEAELTAHGISDLADVTIDSVADGEVLQYDNGTSEWINRTLAEAGIAAATHTHTESDITDLDHYDDADFDARLATKDTGDLAEGANLYYTNARADARIALATLADLATASASDIDSGTLADARLSSNVPLFDQTAFVEFTDTTLLGAGGDETGARTLRARGNSAAFVISSSATEFCSIDLRTANVGRWSILKSSDAETGSNAGGNLQIVRRSDAGSGLGIPVEINRATGIITIGNSIDVQAGVFSNTDQTGVAVSAAGIHAALVNLGLITA